MGYSIITTDDDNQSYKIERTADPQKLREIKSKFHKFTDAMYNPITDIYHDLEIEIPSQSAIKSHKTGIYDDQYIIFELPQVLMENQQRSLVNKTVLNPENLERFINFLKPKSSKTFCRDIYFDKLKSLKVASIGLFGSRLEVLAMLKHFNSISDALYDKLTDKECEDLSPGIHAILPVNLQKEDNIKSWDGIIYLFYWSLLNSFDMKKMKSVKRMRKDPACLLSRVCYISALHIFICN